jgi:outer membrane protein assembly factor BamE
MACQAPMKKQTRISLRSDLRSLLSLGILMPVVLSLLSACSLPRFNLASGTVLYIPEVVQGNFVSKEQVGVLKTGMTRAQVKDTLGTPLVSSLFHQNRWDYVFTLKRQGVEPQSFKYTVYFKGDELERFEGDTMPTEADFIATLASARKFASALPLEATQEQLKLSEKATPSNAATSDAGKTGAEAPAQPKVYPPLEGTTR